VKFYEFMHSNEAKNNIKCKQHVYPAILIHMDDVLSKMSVAENSY
jgi:ABC-type thiamine transport system substrate-binding protein